MCASDFPACHFLPAVCSKTVALSPRELHVLVCGSTQPRPGSRPTLHLNLIARRVAHPELHWMWEGVPCDELAPPIAHSQSLGPHLEHVSLKTAGANGLPTASARGTFKPLVSPPPSAAKNPTRTLHILILSAGLAPSPLWYLACGQSLALVVSECSGGEWSQNAREEPSRAAPQCPGSYPPP